MAPSARIAIAIPAALAVGCAVSLLLPGSVPRILRESSRPHRRLRTRRSHNDPRTVELRVPSAPVLADDVSGTSWWEDIDYGQDGRCGRFKCYFLSASDPARGYLVVDSHHLNGRYSLDPADEYNYAKELESELGIRHFLPHPPFVSKIPDPEYFAGRLDANTKARFQKAKYVVVQESNTAPVGSVIFKCNRYPTQGRMEAELDRIIQHGSDGAVQTLLEEMTRVFPLLESHPWLANDFQFVIDPEGRIWHLDFDRGLKGPRTPEPYMDLAASKKKCLEGAIAYVRDNGGA